MSKFITLAVIAVVAVFGVSHVQSYYTMGMGGGSMLGMGGGMGGGGFGGGGIMSMIWPLIMLAVILPLFSDIGDGFGNGGRDHRGGYGGSGGGY